MANVYRKAAKDVHRAVVSGVRFDHIPCNLDPGGVWGPTIPPGPRCSVCFGGVAAQRKRRMATAAAGAGVLALVAVVLGVQPDGDPVSALATPSFIASGSSAAVPTASPVLVTPEPSLALPTETPALTPTPRPDPTDRATAAPTATPDRPAPTEPPLPSPTCFHPGRNYGVDECRWPHN